MTSIATNLSLAKVGDNLWLYDSEASRYVDGKYQGRGVWKTFPITGETRSSFVVGGYKFDRRTGDQRATGGYSATKRIAGLEERYVAHVRSKRYEIEQAVRNEMSVSKLEQIAAILGINLQEEASND